MQNLTEAHTLPSPDIPPEKRKSPPPPPPPKKVVRLTACTSHVQTIQKLWAMNTSFAKYAPVTLCLDCIAPRQRQP